MLHCRSAAHCVKVCQSYLRRAERRTNSFPEQFPVFHHCTWCRTREYRCCEESRAAVVASNALICFLCVLLLWHLEQELCTQVEHTEILFFLMNSAVASRVVSHFMETNCCSFKKVMQLIPKLFSFISNQHVFSFKNYTVTVENKNFLFPAIMYNKPQFSSFRPDLRWPTGAKHVATADRSVDGRWKCYLIKSLCYNYQFCNGNPTRLLNK